MPRIGRMAETSEANDLIEFLANFSEETHVWCENPDLGAFIIKKIDELNNIKQFKKRITSIFECLNTCPNCLAAYYSLRENLSKPEYQQLLQNLDDQRLLTLLRSSDKLSMITITEILTYNWKSLKVSEIKFHFVKLLKIFYKTEGLHFSKMTFSLILLTQCGDSDLLATFVKTFKYLKKQKILFLHSTKEEWDYLLSLADKDGNFLPEKSTILKQDWLFSILIYLSLSTTYMSSEIINLVNSIYEKTKNYVTKELCFRVCAAYIQRDASELNNCKHLYKSILICHSQDSKTAYKGWMLLKEFDSVLIDHIKNFCALGLDKELSSYFGQKPEIISRLRIQILDQMHHFKPTIDFFTTVFFKKIAILSLKAESVSEKEREFITGSIDKFNSKIYTVLRNGFCNVESLHAAFVVWSEILDNSCGNYSFFTDFIFLFIYEIELIFTKITNTDKLLDIFRVFKRKFFATLDLNMEKLTDEVVLYRDLVKSDFSTVNIHTVVFSQIEQDTISKILEKMNVYYERFREYPRCFEKLMLYIQKSAVISGKIYTEIFNFAWHDKNLDLIIKTLAVLLPKVKFEIPIEKTFLVNLEWLEILHRVQGCDLYLIEDFIFAYYSWMKINNIETFPEYQKERIFDFVDQHEILTIERRRKAPIIESKKPSFLSGFSQDEKKTLYEQNGSDLEASQKLLERTEKEKTLQQQRVADDLLLDYTEGLIQKDRSQQFLDSKNSNEMCNSDPLSPKMEITLDGNSAQPNMQIDHDDIIEISSTSYVKKTDSSVTNTPDTEKSLEHVNLPNQNLRTIESELSSNPQSASNSYIAAPSSSISSNQSMIQPHTQNILDGRVGSFGSQAFMSTPSAIAERNQQFLQAHPVISSNTAPSQNVQSSYQQNYGSQTMFSNSYIVNQNSGFTNPQITTTHSSVSFLHPKVTRAVQSGLTDSYVKIQANDFQKLGAQIMMSKDMQSSIGASNRNSSMDILNMEDDRSQTAMDLTRAKVMSYFHENKEYGNISVPSHKKIELALEQHEADFTNEFFKKVLCFQFDNEMEFRTVDQIPAVFDSYKHYESVFEPLLLKECKESLCKNVTELNNGAAQNCRFVYSESTSDFMELTFKVTENLPDMQVLVFSYLNYNELKSTFFKSSKDWFLGIVIDRKQDRESQVIVLANNSIFRLSQHSTIFYYNLACFSSYYREFIALKTLQFSPLLNSVLVQPNKNSEVCLLDNIRLLNLYLEQERLNQSQCMAIRHIFTNQFLFSLIQGPPGTGKTRTIISAVHTFFHQPVIKSILQHVHFAKETPRILICAPSNNAVDEITRRLIKLRINDRVDPRLKVIRVGVPQNICNDLQNYTLDKMIEHDLETKRILTGTKTLEFTTQEKMKRKFEYLKQCDVVCATLSSSAKDLIKIANISFDFLIIDEACQSVETSTLIPLKFNPIKIILIGDPRQLPPTVLSKSKPYASSLFDRLMKSQPVLLLDVQYRMHPEIADFPNKYFYQSMLKNDISVLKRQNPYATFLKPMSFLKTQSNDNSDQNSYANSGEARIVLEIVKELMIRNQKYNLTSKIGIITPYKAQQYKIKTMLKQISPDIFKFVSVNTVDGFQGQEKDIIIISAVRSKNIGFVQDIKRMNVSITRAKFALVIIGNIRTLSQSSAWSSLISHLQMKNSIYDHWRNLFS
ncbi:tRNA-splicing endonuclease positive effector (SEN1) [Pseudoloma neurophilia]|uniref:tRNA-splicing endonuclease positive effector (SEN1) n=1 Tax=Pseudoloma neurophilia TaxID=146866 RepID=A0A0R0LZE5_9MICR|nr:tRNA-splicing endonuclease positive effector (SEN1) [Pseudoloma neurophilia]